MTGFNFNDNELLTFFAVLVRYSVLFSVLPFVGDRMIPMPVKVLLSLAVSIALFPALLRTGAVHAADAASWGTTTGGIAGTIALEATAALILGFVARMSFETIHFSANLVGNFMGFAAASTYDPHQEAQTQVVAEVQLAIAMLLFLAMDGHHIMLRAALDSYRILGLGGGLGNALNGSGLTGTALSGKLIELTGFVVKFGIQIASPVALALFGVTVVFGILGKAMPQLNIMVLSFAVTAGLGLLMMLMSIPEFSSAVTSIFSRMGDAMDEVLAAIARGR